MLLIISNIIIAKLSINNFFAVTTGYNYIPKTPHVKIFTDEELVLKCSRGDGTGNSGSSNIDIIVSISMNHTLSKTTQIDSLTNSTIVTAKIHSFGGNGSASCVNVADQRNIWTWGLEFVGKL